MSRSDRSAGERARISAMFFIAIALVSSAVAGAASFDYIDVSSDLLSFNPGHFVFDATGAWVTGNATVRYRDDGSVAFVSPVAPFYGDAMLAETSDGGLVEVLTPLVGTPFGSLPCLATKVSANGAMQWQQYIDYNDSCTSLASDGAGTLWIASEVPATANPILVYRIDADGSGFASIAFSSTFVAQAVAAAPTAGSYVAGFDAGTSKATIIALDANGATRWQWSDASAGVTLTGIAVDTAGNVEAVGHAADQTLAVVSVGADGTLRWNQHLAAPGADRSSGFQIAADGSSFVLAPAQDNTHRVLEKISADGTLAWQSDVPVDGIGSYSSWLDEHAGLRLAPNGDILVLADSGGDDGSTTTQLVRFDGDGNVTASTEITGQPDAVAVNVSAMTALADSSALLTTRSNFTASGLASDGSAASSGLFLQVDPTGQIVPNAFATAQVSASSTVVDSVVADGGTTYLVSNNVLGDLDDHSIGGRNTRVALSAISATGTRLWKQEYDGYWQSAHVVADATHVCVFGNFAQYWLVAWSGGTPPAGGMPDVRIECRATGNGSVTSSFVLLAPGLAPAILGEARMRDDGSVVMGYTPGSGAIGSNGSGKFDTATMTANGGISERHTLTTHALPTAIGADGSTLLVLSVYNEAPAVSLVRPDGTVAWNLTLPSSVGVFQSAVLDDGSAEIFELDSDGTLRLKEISTTGVVLWDTVLTSGFTTSTVSSMYAVSDETSTFVTLTFGAEQSAFHGSEVIALDRTTGAIAWSTTLNPAVLDAHVAIGPDAGALLYYALSDYKVTTQRIDRATGVADAPAYRSCGSIQCMGLRLYGARLTADGTLRFSIDSGFLFPATTQAPHVIAIDSAGAPPPAIPVAQSGIAGVWYAPYASGQGFMVDYIANEHTLFVPWFTYSTTGGNDPANLNWFSLQGTAASGDTNATLTIYASAGGAFASGTTGLHAVGSATLGFADCSHGSLNYRFDADADVNAGTTGTISLTRLTPATADCTLAGGANETAPPFMPDDGFTADQSGSWYDAQTSGQGIEFTVVPASGATAGLLFGAWFTYDPEGAADDALAQHWFTLQGDLSSASAGRVTVPIYSTLGGTLDGAPGTTTLPIGTATVTFHECSSATVDYRFDDSAIAHAYRNLSGSLALTRLGGCTQ